MPYPLSGSEMSISSKASRLSLALLTLALLLLLPLASGTEVVLVSSPGCTKCAAAERTLEMILADHPGVELAVYDVYSEEGRKAVREHRLRGGVPAIAVGNLSIAYRDYDGDQKLLEEMVRAALAATPAGWEGLDGASGADIPASAGSIPGPTAPVRDGSAEEVDVSSLSMATVFVAGLLAGFNPCLLGILAFLATAIISSSGRRRDLVMMVAFFSFGIFVMYYLFGVGLLRTLHAGAIAAHLRTGLTVLLIALGLVHIEDARRLTAGGRTLFKVCVTSSRDHDVDQPLRRNTM